MHSWLFGGARSHSPEASYYQQTKNVNHRTEQINLITEQINLISCLHRSHPEHLQHVLVAGSG